MVFHSFITHQKVVLVCFGGSGGGPLSQTAGISDWDFRVLCISLQSCACDVDLVHEICAFVRRVVCWTLHCFLNYFSSFRIPRHSAVDC